ncbi:MAG: B12-binding domain-containing radical SAM protein [Syntrophales bacterium]
MNRGRTAGKGVLLIHPPAAKGCEPPGGPARLAGALRRHGIGCRLWDANLEGQLALAAEAARAGSGADTWTRRAAGKLPENLRALRSWGLYARPERYRRAVSDLNRLVAEAAKPSGVRLSLADYESADLSPVRSGDLLRAAAEPETNPFHRWFSERLDEVLAETPVGVVGFSVNYLSQALTAFAMIGLLRRVAPRLSIVLGGGLVTSWLRRPGWRSPFAGLVDTAIAGPGEAPLMALLRRDHDGGCDRPDLDGLPLADYLAPGPVLPYSASSGCWWRRCSFCPEGAEGNPYRPVPPRRAAAELHALTERFRPVLIHLLDNALSSAHLDALAATPPGAPWYGFTRITPQLADPGFCLRLKDSGCVMLKLGLESADPEVLASLHKGIDPGTAALVLGNLKAAGIATYVYLLFGTPAETPAAARRTLAFTAEHAGEIGFLNAAIFNLPAHGPDTDALDTGEFYDGDLSLYKRFVHPQGWHRGEVRRFLEREFRKEPAIATILRRDPPLFTSNHAPFLVMAAARSTTD